MGALFDQFLSFFPKEPEWHIDWNKIVDEKLLLWREAMQKTQQTPIWHAEGDVWTHTQMVCEELIRMQVFRKLPRRKQQEVFLAALLHDIGKIPCTRLENGDWTSPNHAVVGAKMAREWMWKQYGLSGEKEDRTFRETVCELIRYHAVPTHILTQKNPEHRLIRIAANGELAKDFTVELLCMLSAADVLGRITKHREESLEIVEICAETAKGAECLQKPFLFSSDFSEYAYLSGQVKQPKIELYEDTWGEILLLSGLPGTGKDTWIQNWYGAYPIISLDEIRKQMHISPQKSQGVVVSAAREQAKEYLRKKQPFVWNATNISPLIRKKQVELFEGYHASVRILFLETSWKEGLLRNRQRAKEVPEQVIEEMLRNLVLPEREEAQRVEWDIS